MAINEKLGSTLKMRAGIPEEALSSGLYCTKWGAMEVGLKWLNIQ